MASVVEICNRALSNIGNSRSINSLTEASKEAGECSLHFEACRDAVLSDFGESVTDVRIILECLQEAYQMEGDMVRSGKNIHATMIYPFVRMLQEKCRDLTEEQIHKTLWKEYEISGADRMFVERASKILEPYEGESEDEK